MVAGVGACEVGFRCVQVRPESVLIARPQFVPAYTTLGMSGRMAMPCADGSEMRDAVQFWSAAVGVEVAGLVQVWPPS